MLLEKLAEQHFRYSLEEDFISPISCIIFFFFLATPQWHVGS